MKKSIAYEFDTPLTVYSSFKRSWRIAAEEFADKVLVGSLVLFGFVGLPSAIALCVIIKFGF